MLVTFQGTIRRVLRGDAGAAHRPRPIGAGPERLGRGAQHHQDEPDHLAVAGFGAPARQTGSARLADRRLLGGVGGGPAAEGPQSETAKTVSLGGPTPSGDRQAPSVRGAGYVRTARRSRVPIRLNARRNPRSTADRAPARKVGRRRVGSQGARARARPPPVSGAMPCRRRD